jgi:hypothetical protein
VPDITDILINGLEQITVTENEMEDILKILDTSKAIGPDLLNPHHNTAQIQHCSISTS